MKSRTYPWQDDSPAQAMVEFALVLPVVLMLLMGIIDFGRALFTYAQASAQVRNALRYGVILGYEGGDKNYLDCTGIHDIASSIFFASSVTSTVEYWKASNTSTVYDCPDGTTQSATLDSELSNGDILHVSVTATVNFITPFFIDSLPLSVEGNRTLVKNIPLPGEGASQLGTATALAKTAVVETASAAPTVTPGGPTLTPSPVPTSTLAPTMTNTPDPSTTPSLTPTSTPSVISATLHIWVTATDNTSAVVEVKRITSTWAEGTVTYASTAAAFDVATYGTFTTTVGERTVSVTNLVTNWFNCTYTNYGLMLQQNSGTNNQTATYSSREGTNVPYIEVQTSSGTFNISATQDSWLNGGSTSQNNGSSTSLQTTKHPSQPDYAVLYFNLAVTGTSCP